MSGRKAGISSFAAGKKRAEFDDTSERSKTSCFTAVRTGELELHSHPGFPETSTVSELKGGSRSSL